LNKVEFGAGFTRLEKTVKEDVVKQAALSKQGKASDGIDYDERGFYNP